MLRSRTELKPAGRYILLDLFKLTVHLGPYPKLFSTSSKPRGVRFLERLECYGLLNCSRCSAHDGGHEGSPERNVNADSSRGTYQNNEGMGFWDSLKDLFLPEEDRHTYAENIKLLAAE